MSEKAIIFNIQRYSLHDGGGIRTLVFFKGCPLKCPWCSNPESQSFDLDIMKKESLCIKCMSDNVFQCKMSPDNCPTGALEIIGKEYTLNEVINEVKKDMIFYETTNGGVTLSGGEPLSQGRFCVELLKELKKLHINTAIETTGICNWNVLKEISKLTDVILWDFKIMDEFKAKDIINQDINFMKENFTKLNSIHDKIIPRIPLIPGYTDSLENIDKIIEFIKPFNIKEVHILPFHQYGSSKYKCLQKKYKLIDLNPLKNERIEEIKKHIEENSNIKVIIGGY